MSKLEEIKEAIEIQKKVLEPIKKKFFYESEVLEDLKQSLEKYRLEHGMFYPIEKLKEVAGGEEDFEAIQLVLKDDETNKLYHKWVFHSDISKIDNDGKIYTSGSEDGIFEWKPMLNRYVHDQFHVREIWDEVVGFAKIVFNREDKYNIEPPDVETYHGN